MVHWSLVLAAFCVGALFGMFLTAIVAAGRRDDDE